MRKQLRPFYTPEQLARVYSRTYDHTRWTDHIERVNKTTELLDVFAMATNSQSVADLSCGDGAIVNNSTWPWAVKILGDYTSPGPIEEALPQLQRVDMFVLSETLEHVENPAGVLAGIRSVADHLLLTTPHGETNNLNPEHYWGWDREGIQELLDDTGWTPVACELFTPTTVQYYTFQMWMCS